MTKPKPKRAEAAAGASSEFAAAIKAALGEADGEVTKLDRVAETLVQLAIEGNLTAIKEISDRLDGKAGTTQPGAKPAAADKTVTDPIEVRVKWLKD